MKIVNQSPIEEKPEVPEGKISVRWVSSRNAFQAYIAGRYIAGCSGETPEEAIEALGLHYRVKA